MSGGHGVGSSNLPSPKLIIRPVGTQFLQVFFIGHLASTLTLPSVSKEGDTAFPQKLYLTGFAAPLFL